MYGARITPAQSDTVGIEELTVLEEGMSESESDGEWGPRSTNNSYHGQNDNYNAHQDYDRSGQHNRNAQYNRHNQYSRHNQHSRNDQYSRHNQYNRHDQYSRHNQYNRNNQYNRGGSGSEEDYASNGSHSNYTFSWLMGGNKTNSLPRPKIALTATI